MSIELVNGMDLGHIGHLQHKWMQINIKLPVKKTVKLIAEKRKTFLLFKRSNSSKSYHWFHFEVKIVEFFLGKNPKKFSNLKVS